MPSTRAPSTRSSSRTFIIIMPASTPSTTLHGRDSMAPVVTTPVRTLARTVFTEVGRELLEHAQLIANERASR